ncbi:MAG: EamA family transporter [Saprospiraceae bacterium]|nr:EamA family transporter [Saprospiraceae bacterium]
MSADILLLVVFSGFLHAGWNFLAKTIPGGTAFVWLIAVVMSIVLLPFSVVYVVMYGFDCSLVNVSVLLFTALLHLVYFVLLQKGYEVADLSVVYPLSRGTGPVFATLGAVLFLQEEVSSLGVLGLSLVVLGVLLIAGLGQSTSDASRRKTGVYYGLGIGILIATYTVWDGYAVRDLAIPPLLLEYTAHPFRVLTLTPLVRKRGPEIRAIWKKHWWKVLLISLVSPLAFILVLYAMRQAPVHLVAPAREISIVFGVIFGGKLLTEENFWPRLVGALLILGGIVILAV